MVGSMPTSVYPFTVALMGARIWSRKLVAFFVPVVAPHLTYVFHAAPVEATALVRAVL